MEPEALGVEIGVEEWLQPRHWGAPADFSMKRVSERLAVMSTEKGLEEYRRSKRAHQRVRTSMPSKYYVTLVPVCVILLIYGHEGRDI